MLGVGAGRKVGGMDGSLVWTARLPGTLRNISKIGNYEGSNIQLPPCPVARTVGYNAERHVVNLHPVEPNAM